MNSYTMEELRLIKEKAIDEYVKEYKPMLKTKNKNELIRLVCELLLDLHRIQASINNGKDTSD